MFKIILALLSIGLSSNAFAGDGPIHHAKHNMVLFGVDEIFVSHIVYKVPHNFQVILKVNFDPQTKALYLAERAKFPQQKFIYLLDHMDIKDIDKATEVTGQVFRFDENENKVEIANGVRVERANYSMVFFDELPLSLAAGD